MAKSASKTVANMIHVAAAYVLSIAEHFVAVGECKGEEALHRTAMLSHIRELREACTDGVQYATESLWLFGGKDAKGKRVLGELRAELEAQDVLFNAPKDADSETVNIAAGNRKLLSDTRIIAGCALDPAFSLDESFSRCYANAMAARGKKTGNGNKKTKAEKPAGMSSSEIESAVLELCRQDVAAVFAAIEKAMVAIKEPIKASAVHAIAAQLKSAA